MGAPPISVPAAEREAPATRARSSSPATASATGRPVHPVIPATQTRIDTAPFSLRRPAGARPRRAARRGGAGARSRTSAAASASSSRAPRGSAPPRQRERASPVPEQLVLAHGRLDALDRVEVAVLADEREPSAATSRAGSPPAPRNDATSCAASSTCCCRSSRRGSSSSSAPDPRPARLREPRRRHVQEPVEVDARRRVEHAAQQLDATASGAAPARRRSRT